MRIAALIIGIFGSLAGFIGSIVAMFVGSVAGAFGADDSGLVVGLGLGALLMSIMGLVGAALVIARPRLSAAMMGTSAIVGFVLVFVAYILAAVLLLIAAILAFLGRNSR